MDRDGSHSRSAGCGVEHALISDARDPKRDRSKSQRQAPQPRRPIADHDGMAARIAGLTVASQVLLDFALQRRQDHAAGSLAGQVVQLVTNPSSAACAAPSVRNIVIIGAPFPGLPAGVIGWNHLKRYVTYFPPRSTTSLTGVVVHD